MWTYDISDKIKVGPVGVQLHGCTVWTLTKLMEKKVNVAQPAGAVEYTDYIFAKGMTPPHECLGYDTTQSNGEV